MNQGSAVHARLANALADARRELIDISRHNRLLSTPQGGKHPHCLEIEADPDALFAAITRQRVAFGFAAEGTDPPASHDPSASRRTLPRLGTSLAPEALEKRLLKFFRGARTFEESRV